MLRKLFLVAAFAALLLVVGKSDAQNINITDGTSNYTWTSATGSGNFSGANGSDALFEDIWVVRFQDGDGIGNPIMVETLNSSADVFSVVNNGDTATATFGFFSLWDNVNPLFTFQFDVTVSTSANGNGIVDYDFTAIYGFGGGGNAGAGGVDIFHYFDYAIDGTFGGDDANVVVGGGQTSMTFTGQNGGLARHVTDGANRYEIQAWNGAGNDIVDRINDTYNLTSSPSSLTNVDITGAFQWDFNATTVGEQFTAHSQFAIPEPTGVAVLFVLGLAGLSIRRRRK